jgi:hypothetical protein
MSQNDGILRLQEHMNKTNTTKCVYVKISSKQRKGLQKHEKMWQVMKSSQEHFIPLIGVKDQLF